MNWEERGLSIEGRKLAYLAYADDLVVMAKKHGDLQDMLNELNSASNNIGLKISVKKTCWLTNFSSVQHEININNVKIERVNKFTYLGSVLTADGKTDEEIERRKHLGGQHSCLTRSCTSRRRSR